MMMLHGGRKLGRGRPGRRDGLKQLEVPSLTTAPAAANPHRGAPTGADTRGIIFTYSLPTGMKKRRTVWFFPLLIVIKFAAMWYLSRSRCTFITGYTIWCLDPAPFDSTICSMREAGPLNTQGPPENACPDYGPSNTLMQAQNPRQTDADAL